MGEQSPLAVRGQSMQDVIFAGAHGVQARAEAEVEVVLDNADGAVDLPAGELSIVRRLNRAGEGEYRVNGARCRLTDVLELLSDTGLGKEMHSVVSQGRVEAIVTSKPRDRRMLIEEAAGLGKHRKRRRRAQLKLARTQDNLDRALDVEREARTRLRPLKRQAEAAELHARLERQTDEALWALAREDVRAAVAALAEAEAGVAAARAAAAATEDELRAVAARRVEAEAALAARGTEREGLSNRFYAARSAARADRAARGVGARRPRPRWPSARRAGARCWRRSRPRRRRTSATTARPTASPRSRPSSRELAGDRARAARARAGRARPRGARRRPPRSTARPRPRSPRPAPAARPTPRPRRRGARAARSRRRPRPPAARPPATGAELAKLNQFLRVPRRRSRRGAGARRLARRRARATSSRSPPRSGRGCARRSRRTSRRRRPARPRRPRRRGRPDRARRRRSAGSAGRGARRAAPCGCSTTCAPSATSRLAAALLADVWVVDAFDALDRAFAGVAVTRDGRVWSPATRELRQVPAGGEDKRALRAQPPRCAGRRGRARGAGRARRAGEGRGGREGRPGRRRRPRRGRARCPRGGARP